MPGVVHRPGAAHETSKDGRKAMHAPSGVDHRRPLHSGNDNRAGRRRTADADWNY